MRTVFPRLRDLEHVKGRWGDSQVTVEERLGILHALVDKLPCDGEMVRFLVEVIETRGPNDVREKAASVLVRYTNPGEHHGFTPHGFYALLEDISRQPPWLKELTPAQFTKLRNCLGAYIRALEWTIEASSGAIEDSLGGVLRRMAGRALYALKDRQSIIRLGLYELIEFLEQNIVQSGKPLARLLAEADEDAILMIVLKARREAAQQPA